MKKLLSALLGIFGLFIVPAYAALPSGYTQLEYINMPAGAYLLTDIIPVYNGHYEIDFQTTEIQNSGVILGGRTEIYGGMLFTIASDGMFMLDAFGINSTGRYTPSVLPAANTRYKFIFNNKVATLESGDSRLFEHTFTGTGANGAVLVIKGVNTDGSIVGNNASYYIYSFQAWNAQGTLIANFIPAKNSSGVVGMYDTVGNRFYTNAGTGEFIAGDPVTTCDGTVVNYVSATGTVSQAGTPTPDNPIYPTFYKQGDMVLRKVGDIADSYDATTGKITRRVGEYIFTGRESIDLQYNVYGIATIPYDMNKVTNASLCSHNKTYTNSMVTNDRTFDKFFFFTNVNRVGFGVNDTPPEITNTGTFKQWLAAQYAAGTPVTIYYPLETETTEDWPASQCTTDPIKIATTKYNETKFSPLNTALANAISVVDSVVTQTITQAGRIATLQTQKQTRPADDTCPAYKQCLLVEDEQGVPHWYEITDPFRDFVAPIIANNVAPASTTNDAGYTQLEYIRSDGASWIDTGITGTQDTAIETKFINLSSDSSTTVLIGDGWSNSSYLLSIVAQTGAPNRIGGLNNTLRDFWRTRQEFVVKMDKTGLYVNNSKINWNGSATNFTTTKPLYLLGDPAASGRNSYATLYYMKIYNNGTLVRDFVPVKRNSDSAIGMYDTVSKTFFGNKGTGTFTAGPTVANTDVPANPTWTATWAANATTGVTAGTVYGEGLCNGVSGTNSTPATNEQTASANWNTTGSHCWCKIDSIDIEGSDVNTTTNKWVWITAASGCLSNCSYYCANSTKTAQRFRNIMLNTAQ